MYPTCFSARKKRTNRQINEEKRGRKSVQIKVIRENTENISLVCFLIYVTAVLYIYIYRRISMHLKKFIHMINKLYIIYRLIEVKNVWRAAKIIRRMKRLFWNLFKKLKNGHLKLNRLILSYAFVLNQLSHLHFRYYSVSVNIIIYT